MTRMNLMNVLVLMCLVSFALPATVQLKTDPPANPTSVAQATKALKAFSLAGSYRLRLPLTPFRIKGNFLVIQLCNIHVFKIKKTQGTTKISLALESSTKMDCKNENDQQFIDLLTQATSYKLDGTLYFYKGEELLCKAKRNEGYWPVKENLQGKWNLEILNLPLEVSDTEFSFEGCNSNVFTYKATDDGKITLKLTMRTKKGCEVDTDQIFSSALEKSKFFKTGQVSFTLYDVNGEQSAYGTPYLV